MGGCSRRAGRTLIGLVLALGLCLAASPAAHAADDRHEPTPKQAEAVAATLLAAATARRVTGFRARLDADLEAGPQGGSCYSGIGGWTCDAWFTTSQTASPYPNGVSITVAPSASAARQMLARRAAGTSDRPGDRIVASTPTLLVIVTSGLAVGPGLTPAVAISVESVERRFIVMGSCQAEKRRLRMRALRACADRLLAAQVDRAAGLRL